MNSPVRVREPALGQKRLVIEIGRMEAPAWRSFRKLPLVDQHYMGFDIGHICRFVANCRASAEQISEAGRLQVDRQKAAGHSCEYVHFSGYGHCGDEARLPLADSSVSEAYLSMITGQPRLSPAFVSAMLSDVARVLGPSGLLIAHNGTYSLHGDIMVDYRGGQIIYAENAILSFAEEDRRSPLSTMLNSRFRPMEAAKYPDFLGRRGFMEPNPSPGLSVSILERRP